jgi:lipopolysaccharide transport protein LptA
VGGIEFGTSPVRIQSSGGHMAPYGYVEDQSYTHGRIGGYALPRRNCLVRGRSVKRLRELAGRAGVSLPAYFVAVLLGGGWLTTVDPPASAAALHPAAAAPQAPQPPIVIDAAFSRVDYKTNTVEFKDVDVSQGDARVTAKRAYATGVGFANSQWTFEGTVIIVLQPRGTLRSDQAVVQFRNSRITQATATGKPAQFEQQRMDSRRPVRGRADQIVYNAEKHSVQLSGGARVSDGRAEISGPVLVYNVRDEQLQAVSQGESVHGRSSGPAEERGGTPIRRSPPPPPQGHR